MLYISFFEEKIMLVYFRKSPLKKNIDVILIGGYLNPVQDESLVIVDEPKTQKFPIGSVRQLKYSQLVKLKENFFSGDEETYDLDREVAFKVIDFSPIRLVVILDGKKYKLVPMDPDE
ncbi:MAG: hypothetical protein D6767_00875 [Candidatus Hydrogenedentota bacterium]|nr:MAG: hypothetical protein D6767_00875 [Candidatus Hydrogenedentota bacterium]